MAINPESPPEAVAGASSNGMRTALAFHERDLQHLDDRLRAIEQTLAQVAASLAAHNAVCVTPAVLQLLADRFDRRITDLEVWRSVARGALAVLTPLAVAALGLAIWAVQQTWKVGK